MTRRALLALSIACALSSSAHALRPGDLDPGFAGGGTLRIPIPQGAANDVLVLPDGSAIVAGTGDPENDGATEFMLARVDAAGVLVPGFGDGGLVSTPIPFAETARVRHLTLDPDGRVVAAGISTTELANGDTSDLLQMTRYLPDGQLDRDFGRSGIQGVTQARDVAGVHVAADRSIIFVGRDDDLIGGIVQFGGGIGFFQLQENSTGGDLVPHGERGVLMAGTIGRDFLLMRFLLPGFVPDTGFGQDGSVRTSLGGADSNLRTVLALPDGRIVAIGSVAVAIGDVDIAIVRYEADGRLDGSFGDGGIVVTRLGAFRDDAIDAVLAPDGTMLVGGRTCTTSPGQCSGFVLRLEADGSLDPDFPIFTPAGNVSALALPDDGHVLAVEQVLGELVVHRLVVADCGNGRLEAGEACDDGNTAAGDCCSATCALEPDDTACAEDGSACTADVCRAGTCAHVVPAEAGCLPAQASTLTRTGQTGERLRWEWLGASVDASTFGDPTATTDLSLCVVDAVGESERPLVEVAMPAGGECNGVACWKATRRGFRFRNAGASEGVRLVRLITGAESSRVEVKARSLDGTSDLPVPVKVRLVRHDAPTCFEAVLGPARGTALELQ